MADEVELGKRYRDMVSGYEGVATARTVYLYDTPSIRLSALGSSGKPEHEWISEGQLEALDKKGPGFGS